MHDKLRGAVERLIRYPTFRGIVATTNQQTQSPRKQHPQLGYVGLRRSLSLYAGCSGKKHRYTMAAAFKGFDREQRRHLTSIRGALRVEVERKMTEFLEAVAREERERQKAMTERQATDEAEHERKERERQAMAEIQAVMEQAAHDVRESVEKYEHEQKEAMEQAARDAQAAMEQYEQKQKEEREQAARDAQAAMEQYEPPRRTQQGRGRKQKKAPKQDPAKRAKRAK